MNKNNKIIKSILTIWKINNTLEQFKDKKNNL